MVSKEFTSRKLDWLAAVSFDRGVTDPAFRIAAAIASHLDEKTGHAFVGADSIAFETGCQWPRKVMRAVKLLKARGWLDWHRTGTANVYKPDYRKVKATLAVIGRWRYEKRQIFLKKRTKIGRQRHSASKPVQSDTRGTSDMTPASRNHLMISLQEIFRRRKDKKERG